MDENQKPEEVVNNYEVNTLCRKHPWWKCLLCALMTFLGAFCAFYVVTDWHFKAMLRMKHRIPYEERMESFAHKEIAGFENFMGKEGKKFKKNAIIHIQNSGKAYRIIVDLRAFDNNENNIQVSTNGNILTLAGRSVRKSKHDEQISEFQQNYLFGSNVKLDSLTKETNGNYYIITIPFEKPDVEED